jgi:hypothetical protein
MSDQDSPRVKTAKALPIEEIEEVEEAEEEEETVPVGA